MPCLTFATKPTIIDVIKKEAWLSFFVFCSELIVTVIPGKFSVSCSCLLSYLTVFWFLHVLHRFSKSDSVRVSAHFSVYCQVGTKFAIAFS